MSSKTMLPWFALSTLIGALLLSSVASSDEVGTSQHFLTGGTPVPEGELAAVGRVPGCTATLIEPDLVLTAAHCVCTGETTRTGCNQASTFTLENVRPVDDPATPVNESLTRRNVSMQGSVRVHPSYTSDGWMSHDFAVVDLNQPASDLVLGVSPIPLELPTRRPELGDQLRIVGYGRTGESCNSPPNGKRELILPLHEISTGNVTLRIGTFETGACPGDSGGPAFNGAGNIVGVASSSPGNYDPTDLAYNWIYPDTFTVGEKGVHGFHFEQRDRHQFNLVSAYPLTLNGILTYEWDNVRDPGPSRFIRRLVVKNQSDFPVSFRLEVSPVSVEKTPHSVELDSVESVAANGKHGFHFERRDQHQFYMESVYPTTVNGRITYEWDNVRDPGASSFIRRLTVINKSDFPVSFKIKVVRINPPPAPTLPVTPHFGLGLELTELLNETRTVAAGGKHGMHFERRDEHQFYLVSAYPTTVNGRLTYEWNNVRDPGSLGFIRRLTVTNKSSFPVTFKVKVSAVVVRPGPPVLSDD